MSFELENDDETIEIDFNNRSIKGQCKAKDWKKHFKKVMEAFR